MNSLYCRMDGNWFYRENKKAENWFGPFVSRKAAVKERMEKRLSALKSSRVAVILNSSSSVEG